MQLKSIMGLLLCEFVSSGLTLITLKMFINRMANRCRHPNHELVAREAFLWRVREKKWDLWLRIYLKVKLPIGVENFSHFRDGRKKLILCATMCAVGDILSGNLLTTLIIEFSSERKRKFSIVIFDFHHSQLHYFWLYSRLACFMT